PTLAHGDAAHEESEADHLLAASSALSATTTVDGAGPEAYAKLLHEDFSRWTAGGDMMTREAMIQGLREWWDAGMRVADSETEILFIKVVGDVGILRKKTTENYIDASKEAVGSFTGFASMVWKRGEAGWKLLSLDVTAAE
ncbi:MAG: nuclear transport factor 2 family protein, partial [Candidatus Eisenbacteria bacterium]|nr:nuclear transport factor 2 family protein [Candidatus Eisenbacteria bacterium]